MNQSKIIYIGNLPLNITEDEIKDLFDKFGTIVSFRFAVSMPDSKIRPDFAFIQLSDINTMQNAVNKLDEFYYQNKFLIVKLIDYPSNN